MQRRSSGPVGPPLPLPHPRRTTPHKLSAKRATAPYTDIPAQNSKDTLSEELTPVPTGLNVFQPVSAVPFGRWACGSTSIGPGRHRGSRLSSAWRASAAPRTRRTMRPAARPDRSGRRANTAVTALGGRWQVSRATFHVRSKFDGRHLHPCLDGRLLKKLGDRDFGARSLNWPRIVLTIR